MSELCGGVDSYPVTGLRLTFPCFTGKYREIYGFWTKIGRSPRDKPLNSRKISSIFPKRINREFILQSREGKWSLQGIRKRPLIAQLFSS